jgi:hypothetical protein
MFYKFLELNINMPDVVVPFKPQRDAHLSWMGDWDIF